MHIHPHSEQLLYKVGGGCGTSHKGGSWCGKGVAEGMSSFFYWTLEVTFFIIGVYHDCCMTSDQGREFRNQLYKEMMSLLGVKHHLVTSYHPQVNEPFITCFNQTLTDSFLIPNHQANGLDERWNQTMKKMLVKYTWRRKETWDEHLHGSCVFAYNTSQQESTLYSPFELGEVRMTGSASHWSRYWQWRTKQTSGCLPWRTTGK